MPKRNPNPAQEPKLELEDFQDSSGVLKFEHLQRVPAWAYSVVGLLVLAVVVVVGFDVAYAGHIYPGVTADGVPVGGLTQSQAISRITSRVSTYSGGGLSITHGRSVVHVPLYGLSLKYNAQNAAQLAVSFGRQGSLANQLHQKIRALFDRPTNYADYSYLDSSLTSYILQMDGDVDTPVADATLSFDGSNATANPAINGKRLDLGLLTQMLNDRLASTSSAPVVAPVYEMAPAVSTSAVQDSIGQISSYISSPVTLSYMQQTSTISQKTILSWIQVTAQPTPPFLQSLNLHDLYPPVTGASLSLNQNAVESFVANLAGQIDQNPLDATLSMQNGQLSVVSPSQSGLSLDQNGAVNGIMVALTEAGANRNINLNLSSTSAPVTQTNLASLGITTLLSSGQTYFPGSPYGRLVNVRTGAARYNNLLISPGEEFDFGAQLGVVDAATGYVPELVIEGNHEDFQYGGGLCQVCTTAFRAALAAGLPIDERENHSFAISYYQWPYDAPGVDATIFYPQVDLKFTNNTGHYILIQTVMTGDHLTFNFYGTKVESGVIRGPYFITGSNNATQASHTVFYRDVENDAGKVTSTDAFNSYYEPSTDFPIEGTVN